MWSTNLESQAAHARERYAALRTEAAHWRARRSQRGAAQRTLLPAAGTHWAGRLLARMGGWLIVTGVRWQQAAEARRSHTAAAQRSISLADVR